MKVICYGDSNTYGYDPRSYFGGRYRDECIWTNILAEHTGWEVQNEGWNGREIPEKPFLFPENIDFLIVMLGTNDLLQGNTPDTVALRMEKFIHALSLKKNNILLIAPVPMKIGEWVPDEQLIQDSRELAKKYHILSRQLGIPFMNTTDWEIPLCYDGIHFTEAGHHLFAVCLLEFLDKEMKLCCRQE